MYICGERLIDININLRVFNQEQGYTETSPFHTDFPVWGDTPEPTDGSRNGNEDEIEGSRSHPQKASIVDSNMWTSTYA